MDYGSRSPNDDSGLAAVGVSAGYGDTTVLNAIDLVVPPGKLTALVGPNGCGKSTFLSALCRILKTTSGQVLLDGKEIHDRPTREVARRLGLLPQSPLVPESISVYDLVSRGRYPHQGLLRQWSQRDADAVADALALTETAEYSQRPVDSLSGGQRQRCWIAMTLAQETGIILLDEPTTFLDLRYQVEILSLLASLVRDHGRTIAVVLHDLNFAAAHADHIVMMKDGRIVASGPTEETFTSERIEAVFQVPVHIVRHPQTGRPWCMPQSLDANRIVGLAAE